MLQIQNPATNPIRTASSVGPSEEGSFSLGSYPSIHVVGQAEHPTQSHRLPGDNLDRVADFAAEFRMSDAGSLEDQLGSS